MDVQKILFLVFSVVLTMVMVFAYFNVEKAIKILAKLYGVFGIKLEFNKRGKTLVKALTLLASIVLVIGIVSVFLFE